MAVTALWPEILDIKYLVWCLSTSCQRCGQVRMYFIQYRTQYTVHSTMNYSVTVSVLLMKLSIMIKYPLPSHKNYRRKYEILRH